MLIFSETKIDRNDAQLKIFIRFHCRNVKKTSGGRKCHENRDKTIQSTKHRIHDPKRNANFHSHICPAS